MGKNDSDDPKRAAKKASKRAEKDARKQERRIKKEQKRREREARKSAAVGNAQVPSRTASLFSSTTPSVLKLSKEDLKKSVFFKKEMEVSLSLLPAAIGNVHAALEASIRSMLLKYIKDVGMLLTFSNLKVLSNNGHGMILDELPYLNYKVGFEGLVFCPKVGCTVRGCNGLYFTAVHATL